MSNLLDSVIPDSMWREKGSKSAGKWKVTSRHYVETLEGMIEVVRATHFPPCGRGPAHRTRHLSAQLFLREFVYILPEERYRRQIPDTSPAEPSDAGEQAKYIERLESRLRDLEIRQAAREILERPLV